MGIVPDTVSARVDRLRILFVSNVKTLNLVLFMVGMLYIGLVVVEAAE